MIRNVASLTLWGCKSVQRSVRRRENEIGKIKRQYRVVNKAEISVNESQLRGGMPTKVPAMFFLVQN